MPTSLSGSQQDQLVQDFWQNGQDTKTTQRQLEDIGSQQERIQGEVEQKYGDNLGDFIDKQYGYMKPDSKEYLQKTLGSQVGEYQKLQGQENLTPQQQQRKEELKSKIDEFYTLDGFGGRNNGAEYTDYLDQQAQLKQQQTQLQEKLKTQQARRQELDQQLQGVPQSQRRDMSQQWQQRNAEQRRAEESGAAIRETQLPPELESALAGAQASPDGRWNKQAREQITQALQNTDNPQVAADLADQLAGRMQDGNGWAFNELSGAADSNPRAKALLDNLPVSEAEKARLSEQIGGLGQGQDWNERSLQNYAEHRPGARDSIVGGMTDYIANHTSDQKDYGARQNPQGMENFLNENRELFRDNNLSQRLSTAKLGQARMDMFEGHGASQRAGYQRVSSALRGNGETAEQARDFVRDYEGHTYGAANMAAENKDYDTLAQITQAKNAGSSEAGMLAEGGLPALQASQRQWEHLNDRGKGVVGDSFNGNKALGKALKEEQVPGLAGSVGDALGSKDYFSSGIDKSFEALGEANTEASREALLGLGSHQKSGRFAMDKLSETTEGRQKFFEGITSDNDTTRKNSLATTQGIDEMKGWSQPEQGQYLDSLVTAHGKGDAADRQAATQKIGDQIRFQDVPRANRVEGYGRLMAQADGQQGDAGDSTRGLAYQVGGTVPTGYARYGSNPAEDIRSQQQLEAAAAGNNNDVLTSQLGGASKEQMELADSRLRHAGREEGMVGRLDQMRQNDPNGYSRMLEEVNKTGWGRPESGVGDFLQDQAAQAPPQQGYQSQMPDTQVQALKERLGSVSEKLSTQPNSTAGQMHQDLQANKQFREQLDGLYRERDSLGRQGQDTDAVQGRIDQLVSQHEQARFDSQGMDGRLQAADSLGTDMQDINRYAEANNIRGRDFDNLLMKSAELKRMGNGDALSNMLQQTEGEKGLQPDEMDLMMDTARDTSKDRFNSIFSGGNAEQSREKFTQMALREMRDYAQGERDRFFGNEGRYDTRGERMTDYLIDQGYGNELLYDSKGGPSAMDRMIGEDTSDSRAAADRVLDRIGEVTPADTPLGRAGQLYENRLDQSGGESGRQEMQRLEELHANPAGLEGQDRQLQQRVNADVRTDQSAALLRDKVGPGAALDRAVNDYRGLLDKVEKEQGALPEDISNNPQFKNASVGLEASRQGLDARLDGLEAQQRQEKLERQRNMMLEEGMDSRNIAAMMRGALNSPTDRLFLGVNAKAGVEVQAPLFGSAEAFVEGKVGFETAMTETGQVNVSFDARVGAGANAQAGVGKVKVGAAAGAEKFGKLTYSFGSIDEAAKFTHAMFYDVQKAMPGPGPEGPRPTYANPVESSTGGTKFSGSVELGGVKFSRDTVHAKRSLEQKKPWLVNEEQPKRHTEVDTVNDTMRAQLGPVGLQLEADDQRGDRNPLANGTDLIMRADVGGKATAGSLKPTEATGKMVDTVMAGMDKLKPGWMGKLSPEEARQKLFKTFSRGDVSVNAKGALELTMTNPNNLMTDGSGNMTGNAGTVLGDLVSSSLSDEPSAWQFQNFRSAVEVGAEFSGRARYGTGFVNAFAELGVKFDYRDANTHFGSLNHGRMMLHSTRPGVAMDESQLSEMEKDGLLHRSGRDKGQLNVDAFNYSLGRMRGEFMGMYNDPQWRAENAVLADGTSMGQERFENNIDTYLRDVRESVFAGLVNTDRVDQSQIQAYEQQVNMDSIAEAQQFFQDNGLMSRSDAEAMKAYLIHMGRIDPVTQHEIR